MTKQAPTTKIANGIDNGFENQLGFGSMVYAKQDFDYDRGIFYTLSFHDGEMPAYQTDEFDTLQDLANAMRECADLRTWRLIDHA